jgi:hypothetical protein
MTVLFLAGRQNRKIDRSKFETSISIHDHFLTFTPKRCSDERAFQKDIICWGYLLIWSIFHRLNFPFWSGRDDPGRPRVKVKVTSARPKVRLRRRCDMLKIMSSSTNWQTQNLALLSCHASQRVEIHRSFFRIATVPVFTPRFPMLCAKSSLLASAKCVYFCM